MAQDFARIGALSRDVHTLDVVQYQITIGILAYLLYTSQEPSSSEQIETITGWSDLVTITTMSQMFLYYLALSSCI